MSIQCIIVDDEPLSQDIIKNYIEDINQLEFIATCNDAFEAMEIINTEQVDLIFLDINMPKLSGMSLAKSLRISPEVIFVTAYPQYAVEGFEVDAIDYLLKPFSAERFLSAVNKAINKIEQSTQTTTSPSTNHFIVKSDKKLHRIAIEDILYFKSIGDFVKVYTKNGVLISNEKLKDIAPKLSKDGFIRIHKTYIVPLNKIEYIEGNRVNLNGEMLPIGLTYKNVLLDMFMN